MRAHHVKGMAIAVALAGIGVAPVHATEILKNSTVLVSGNFNTTAGGGLNTVGTNPKAEVGAWITNPGNSHEVFITNDPSPGAFEGDGYLEIRNYDAQGGSFDAAFAPITTVGDTFHWRSKVYVPAAEMSRSDDYQFTVRVTGTAGFPGDYILLTTIRNGVVNAYNGSTYVPTQTSLVADQWSTWDISYTRGASTFSWLVNGAGDTAAPTIPGASGRNIGYVNFFGNYTGGAMFPVYLDALNAANDTCAAAAVILDGQVTGTTSAATNDGSTTCGSSNSSPDVWYSYTALSSGTLSVAATAVAPFTQVVVSLHSGCPGTDANTLACGSGGSQSGFTLPATSGAQYLIRVSGMNGASGGFRLGVQLSTTPPPVETTIDRMLNITWHLGPDLPYGFQDSDGGVIDNTLITVGGFCSGEYAPSKPGVYPRGFYKRAWGLDLAQRQNGWFDLPDFPGDARQELFAARVNDELYLWGGFSYTDPLTYQDGYKLTHQGGIWSWQSLPSLPWKVCSSGITSIGSKIYVCGGADYDLNAFYTLTDRYGGNVDLGAHLIVLDTANLAAGWQSLPDCPGTPRWVHVLSAVNGKLYLIGGATGDSVGGALPYCSIVDNWMFDPATNVWTRLRDLPISSGNFPNGSNLVFQNRYILLVGGFQYACAFDNRVSISPYGTAGHAPEPNDTYFNDVFVYDTLTGLFGRADSMPLDNNAPMTVLEGDEMFLIGGETGTTYLTDSPSGVTYDPSGEYFGHHPDLCLVGQLTVNSVRPDFDVDRDVDGDDFNHFEHCISGPGVPQTDPSCLDADLDGDGDVDQSDFGIFQGCMTGPGNPVILGCDQ